MKATAQIPVRAIRFAIALSESGISFSNVLTKTNKEFNLTATEKGLAKSIAAYEQTKAQLDSETAPDIKEFNATNTSMLDSQALLIQRMQLEMLKADIDTSMVYIKPLGSLITGYSMLADKLLKIKGFDRPAIQASEKEMSVMASIRAELLEEEEETKKLRNEEIRKLNEAESSTNKGGDEETPPTMEK